MTRAHSTHGLKDEKERDPFQGARETHSREVLGHRKCRVFKKVKGEICGCSSSGAAGGRGGRGRDWGQTKMKQLGPDHEDPDRPWLGISTFF